MINSMTAFGRRQAKGDWGMAIWEVKSVNHRYLELSIRLPESLRELEPSIRDMLQKVFMRGKVECHVRFYPGGKLAPNLNLNRTLLDQLITLANSVSQQLPEKQAIMELTHLLAWEGVLVADPLDVTLIRDSLLKVGQEAIMDLQAGRQREGQALAHVIVSKLDAIAVEIEKIQTQLPQLAKKQRAKILQRLEEAKLTLDPQRLEQEILYFLQKIDITEEIDRTFAHIAEVRRVLQKGESAGRRLDFMMQELNREANTLASKAADAQITHAAVEMKLLIEQIREQVQNIE